MTLTEFEKNILKQAIGLVICNEQNPRDVARWFADRVEPASWRLSALELLFQQARDGACLETMERFLEVNRRSSLGTRRRRAPEIKVDIPFLTNASVEHDPFDF